MMTTLTNGSQNDNVDSTQTKNSQQSVATQDQYPFVVRKLIRYRHRDQYFRIEWTDGSRTWEPQENVHPDLVTEYFRRFNKHGRLRKGAKRSYFRKS